MLKNIDETIVVDAKFKIDELCKEYIVKSTNSMKLSKGINVCLAQWNTNNDETSTKDFIKMINIIKNFISKLKETTKFKDCEYTEKVVDITLKKDDKQVNIHFQKKLLSTDFIVGKIKEFCLECKEENNINVNATCLNQFPLYIMIIDTNNPFCGALYNLRDEQEIIETILLQILENLD